MIQGPITGGKHGWAFGRPIFDLATRGYVEEEFFIAGDATTYRPVAGAEWGRDGNWQAEPKGKMPFKTRFLVYRPADPKAFNGTVVVCWNNVTAGYELFHGESPEILEGGYAYVGASVQRAGVHGFPANPQGLAAWDPQRYGELSIPTDEGSYDIFAQVGRAVGPNRDRSGIDPLGGLRREESHRPRRLAIRRPPRDVRQRDPSARPRLRWLHAADLFRRGRAARGRPDPRAVGAARGGPRAARRQSDPRARRAGDDRELRARSDRLLPRAPAGHRSLRHLGIRRHHARRGSDSSSCATRSTSASSASRRPLPQNMNRIALTPYYDAALHHLKRWVDGGAPPPSQPLHRVRR